MSTPGSSYRNKSMSTFVKRVFLSCLLLMLTQNSIYGQNYANTPLGVKAGTPAGSYALTNVDTVSLFNGQVNVRLPLVNETGRGGAKSQMSFTWDSPMRYQVYNSTDPFGNPVWSVGGGSTNPDGTVSYGFHSGE